MKWSLRYFFYRSPGAQKDVDSCKTEVLRGGRERTATGTKDDCWSEDWIWCTLLFWAGNQWNCGVYIMMVIFIRNMSTIPFRSNKNIWFNFQTVTGVTGIYNFVITWKIFLNGSKRQIWKKSAFTCSQPIKRETKTFIEAVFCAWWSWWSSLWALWLRVSILLVLTKCYNWKQVKKSKSLNLQWLIQRWKLKINETSSCCYEQRWSFQAKCHSALVNSHPFLLPQPKDTEL